MESQSPAQASVLVSSAGRARRAVRNSFSLTSAEILSRLFTWLTILFLVRHWSPDEYGQYAVAANWITIFGTFTGLGIGALTIRNVAHDKSKANFYFRNSVTARLATSAVFVVGLFFLGPLLHYEPILCAAMAVMGLRLLFEAPSGSYIVLLQAHEKMTYQALVSVGGAFLRMAGIVGVVYWGGKMVAVSWVWVWVAALSLIPLWRIGRGHGWKVQWNQIHWREVWELLGQSIPFWTFGALQIFYYRVDSVILKGFSGNEAVALYDVAGRILFVVFMISDHFGVSTLPSFSAAQNQPADLARLATRSLKLLIFLGLPLTVGGVLLADPLMALMFGAKYAAAGPAFAVLALSIFLHFATKPSINLLAVKSPSQLTILFFFLFSLNVGLNFWAIPKWGLMGAAGVSDLCEVVFFLWALRLTRSYFNFSDFGFFRGFFAAVAASLVMGLGIYGSPGLYWLFLGPLVYGVIFVLLRGLDDADQKSLQSIFKLRSERI